MNERYDNLNFYEFKNSYEEFKDLEVHMISGDLSTPIPTYSILIPTYKRPVLLKESIECVLNQNKIKDYEIVVIDNDPERNTPSEKMMEKYKNNKKILYYKVKEYSHGRVHKGVELSRGEWFTMLCDDDLLMPNYLYTVDKILNKYPHIEALACGYKIMSYDFHKEKEFGEDNFGIFKKIKRKFDLFWNQKFNYLSEVNMIGEYFYDHYYLKEGVNPWLGVMYKRQNLIDIGGWNISYWCSCDWILNTNYLLKYNLFYTTEVLAVKREGNGNDSARKEPRVDWMIMDYSYYKTFEPHLKVLEYDEKYIKSMMADQAERIGLDFEDFDLVVDGKKLFDKKDFTQEMISFYKHKRTEYSKKLHNSLEPLEFYTTV